MSPYNVFLRTPCNVPEFLYFVGGLLLTHIVLLLMPDSFVVFGLCLVFWSFFGAIRVLWILETVFLFKNLDNTQRSKMLPWIILNSMNIRQRLDLGFAAMRAHQPLMVLWLLLGGVYVLWGIYTVFFPNLPSAVLVLQTKISLFLESTRPDIAPRYDSGSHTAIRHLFEFFLIGLMVWLCRTYAYTLPHLRPLYILIFGLFGISLLVTVMTADLTAFTPPLESNWTGFGWGLFPLTVQMGLMTNAPVSSLFVRIAEVGMGGTVFLYMPCILIALILIKNSFRTGRKRIAALTGLGILLVLQAVDLYVVATPRLFCVWLSGWSSVGLLWQASTSAGQKKYTINQQ